MREDSLYILKCALGSVTEILVGKGGYCNETSTQNHKILC